MKCRNCRINRPMLMMINTLRPVDERTITVKYACTDCGATCITKYELSQVTWDENEAILDIDDDSKDEEMYFVK